MHRRPSTENEDLISVIAAHKGTMLSFEYAVHSRLERCDPGSDYRETRPTPTRVLDITIGEGRILEVIEAALAGMNVGETRRVEISGADASDIAHELSVEVWDTLVFNLKVLSKITVPRSDTQIHAFLERSRVPCVELGVVSCLQKGPILVEKTFDTEHAKRIGQEHTLLQAALDHFSSQATVPLLTDRQANFQNRRYSNRSDLMSVKISRAVGIALVNTKSYLVSSPGDEEISLGDAAFNAIDLNCGIVVLLSPIIDCSTSLPDRPFTDATKGEMSEASWTVIEDLAFLGKEHLQAWRCCYRLSGAREPYSLAIYHLGSWTPGLSPQIRVWDALWKHIASFEGANSHILIIEAPLHSIKECPEIVTTPDSASECRGVGCRYKSSGDKDSGDVVALRSYATTERDRSKKDKPRSLGVWGRASTLIAADVCADQLREWSKASNDGGDVTHDINVASVFWELNTCLPSLGEETLMSQYCNKCVRRALVPSQSQYKFVFKSLCAAATKLKHNFA